MSNDNNCICKLFKKIPPNTLVSVTLPEEVLVFRFLKIEGNCITGAIGNVCIILDCKSIISVSCNVTCTITLNNPGPISCSGTISGEIICGGVGVAGITVNLTSTPAIVTFANPNPVTNANGVFSTTVTIPANTPVTPVTITATATVNGETLTTSITTTVECISCVNPVLSLTVPESIVCTGNITGTLTCNGTGIPGIEVFFTIIPSDNSVVIIPNPVTTVAGGVINALIQSIPGVNATYTITASANVGGQTVTAGPFSVHVNCPALPCSCKVNLNTDGSAQPGAVISVNGTPLTGTLNINVVECGASATPQSGCNPSVDNFNFTFNASNGNTYQFTQGRRLSLTCGTNTATLIGVAQGSVNNGPKTTYNVTITATLDSANNIITWTILATDGTNTFQTTVPFIAGTSKQSFIAPCV